MADAPVTRAELERAADNLRNGRYRSDLNTLSRLAESVLAALDSPASDEEIEATTQGRWWSGDEAASGFRAGERSTLARIVADEKGGSGGE